jgi:hypothetical protein
LSGLSFAIYSASPKQRASASTSSNQLGDAVIFDQRQAGKLYWQCVLLDVAAHRVLDDRDGHEQLRVVHLVIFDELIVAEHRLALQ